jgi:DNA-binding PadR family transcriptional regulator
MVENIANKFERTMKKGFINIFVLMALKKEPTHGYQIKKLIKERTLGFWAPTDSTMYTILKDLRDRDLIRLSDNQDQTDSRKIYELTEKGMETLDLMLKKEEEMRQSMKSIFSLTMDNQSNINDEFFNMSIEDLIRDGPQKLPPFKGGQLINRMNILLKNGSLEVLRDVKELITMFLEKIDAKITELESDTISK